MRLTRAGEYAVRCIAFLTTLGASELASRGRVAEQMGVPAHFLAKIAQQLGKAGLVEIVQGAKGGFRLARPASEITMLDVVEAVMGRIALNDCVLRPDICKRSPACPVHQVWQEANAQLRATLAAADFATMVAGDTCMAEMLHTTAAQRNDA